MENTTFEITEIKEKREKKKIKKFSKSMVIFTVIASICFSMLIPIASAIIYCDKEFDGIYERIFDLSSSYDEIEAIKDTSPIIYDLLKAKLDEEIGPTIKQLESRQSNLSSRLAANEILAIITIIVGGIFIIALLLKRKKAKNQGFFCVDKKSKNKTILFFVSLIICSVIATITLLHHLFELIIGNFVFIYKVPDTGNSIIGIVFSIFTIVLSILLISLLTKNYQFYPELSDEKFVQIEIPRNDYKEDNLDKIAKLKELLDSNAITEEEFDKKKKELLNL